MKKLRCTSSTIELSAKLRRRKSCVERVMPMGKVYYSTRQINNVAFDQQRAVREREKVCEHKRDSWLIIHKSGTNIAPASMLHKRKLPKNLQQQLQGERENKKQIESKLKTTKQVLCASTSAKAKEGETGEN